MTTRTVSGYAFSTLLPKCEIFGRYQNWSDCTNPGKGERVTYFFCGFLYSPDCWQSAVRVLRMKGHVHYVWLEMIDANSLLLFGPCRRPDTEVRICVLKLWFLEAIETRGSRENVILSFCKPLYIWQIYFVLLPSCAVLWSVSSSKANLFVLIKLEGIIDFSLRLKF